MNEQQFDIFMSHKKQDKLVVRQIADRLLDEYSIRCWLDEWDLSAGDDWEQAIASELNSCAACAVFLGSNGWGEYHLKEAQFALDCMNRRADFRVIPVLLPGAQEQEMNKLGDFFQKKHRVDFSNGINDELAFQSLRASIRREAQGPAAMTAFTIRRDAQRWRQAPGNDKSTLFRGYELREGQKIAAQFPETLNEAAVQFLAASSMEEQRVIQSERRRNRIIITVLTLLLIAFAASTVYAFRKRTEAERQTGIANEQTRIANEQREEALRQSNIAEMQSRLAEERRQAEEKQRNIAQDQTRIAEVRRNEAEREKRNAQKQQQLAEHQRRLADEEAEKYRRLSYVGTMSQAQKAREQRDNTWLLELLESQAPPPGKEDLRGFEWYYLRRLAHTTQPIFLGKTGPALCARFSPDGRKLAIGYYRGGVQLWDIATGQLEKTLDSPQQYVGSVAYSPDGRSLAINSGAGTAGRQAITVWDVETGRKTSELRVGDFRSFDFTPDGKGLAVGYFDGRIAFWDKDTGRTLWSINGYEKSTSFVLAVSPDGKWLAAGGDDDIVKLWELSTGKEVLTFKGQLGRIYCLAFSPDGKRLVGGGNNSAAKVWSLEGQPMQTLEGHTRSIHSVAFSPDGQRIATGSADHSVRIWNAGTGRVVLRINAHADSISSVSFSPDGRSLASASWDWTVKVWEAANERWDATTSQQQEVLTLKVDPDGTHIAIFSPDGKRLLSKGSQDFMVKLWDADTGKEVATLGKEATQIIDLGVVPFSPDGKFVATSAGKGTIKLSSATTGEEIKLLKGDQAGITSYAFSPDGRMLASGSGDRRVKLWDINTGQELITFDLKDVGSSVAFSPNGNMLVAGDLSGYVKVWETTSGREVMSKRVYGPAVSVKFSPDGSRVTAGSMQGSIELWDIASGKSVVDGEVHQPGVPSLRNLDAAYGRVAFSPDSTLMAIGGKNITREGTINRTIDLWSTLTGRKVRTLKGHEGDIYCLAFSPDGKRLASGGGDSTVKLWDMNTDSRQPVREVLSLNAHTMPISSIAFSPDGKKLATSSYDNTVKIWNATTGMEVGPPNRPLPQ